MNCWLMILEDFVQTIIEYLNKQFRIFSPHTHVDLLFKGKQEGRRGVLLFLVQHPVHCWLPEDFAC